MDPDFQERMFARQIAVMKGQAWNVVETLKTPDHGPLELTRRAKVCVWDDLVDVPVAVPMRVASAEMRRAAAAESDAAAANNASLRRVNSDIIAEEEMDIGAFTSEPANVAGSAPAAPTQVVDLLGMASPVADLPNPGRFEMAMAEEPSTPGTASEEFAKADAPSTPSNHLQPNGGSGSRPPLMHASQSHPRTLNMYSPDRGGGGIERHNRSQSSGLLEHHHQRRFSFATPATRRESNSIAAQLYGAGGRASWEYNEGGEMFGYEDELEGGDLGYAAATGMEGNQRKVIVERLEPVKTRNPVFTCW